MYVMHKVCALEQIPPIFFLNMNLVHTGIPEFAFITNDKFVRKIPHEAVLHSTLHEGDEWKAF